MLKVPATPVNGPAQHGSFHTHIFHVSQKEEEAEKKVTLS